MRMIGLLALLVALATPAWAANDETPRTGSTIEAQIKCRDYADKHGRSMPAIRYIGAFYSPKVDKCFFRYAATADYPSIMGGTWKYGEEIRDGIHPAFETGAYVSLHSNGTWHCSDNVKRAGVCPRTLDAYIETLR